MQDIFEEMVSKHGLEDKVVALITDTPATMRRLWSLVETDFPQIITLGCWMHVINLFLSGRSYSWP